MKKFIIETIQTFHETHVVEAENEEMARKIVEYSDYNSSQWLGQNILTVRDFSISEIERLLASDGYFFKGCASIDEEGMLYYKNFDGSVNQNMNRRKVFEK
ncbi:MAG: hypothetical protein RI995_1217 [Bacteroidota bacterium]